MSATLRAAIANRLLRIYPRRWRRRYEAEMRDVLAQKTVRTHDLFDLVRSAGGEWEHELARGRFGPLKAIGTGYLALVVVYATSSLITRGVVYGYPRSFFAPDQYLLKALVGYPVAGGMFLLFGLCYTLPILMGLRLARRRISVRAARAIAATGLTLWSQFAMYRMEWYDVWRHGVPDFGYLVNVYVPIGLAFSCAGAIIGSALVRTASGDPAKRASKELADARRA